MLIDDEKMRDDLKRDCLGAFFSGNYGAALIDVSNIEMASSEELLKIAQRLGKNVNEYEVDE